MTYIGYLLLGLNPNIQICFAVFLVAFSTYSLNKLTDMSEDAINIPERVRFLSGRKNVVLFYSIAAYILSAMLVFFNKPLALPVIFIPIAANAVYSTKLLPGIPRLKDIPVMKNIVVAISWALVTVLLPGLQEAPATAIYLIIYLMTAKLFINTVLYDIRDVKGDRENGIRTIPVITSPITTTILLVVVNISLLPCLALAETCVRPLITLLVAYGFIYIMYFRSRKHPFALDFFVDGEWMLVSILLMALSGIYSV